MSVTDAIRVVDDSCTGDTIASVEPHLTSEVFDSSLGFCGGDIMEEPSERM